MFMPNRFLTLSQNVTTNALNLSPFGGKPYFNLCSLCPVCSLPHGFPVERKTKNTPFHKAWKELLRGCNQSETKIKEWRNYIVSPNWTWVGFRFTHDHENACKHILCNYYEALGRNDTHIHRLTSSQFDQTKQKQIQIRSHFCPYATTWHFLMQYHNCNMFFFLMTL